MKYYAYLRCSTQHQSYARQVKQLSDFLQKEGIKSEDVEYITEKRSGANQDRPKFKKLVTEILEQEKSGVHCCLILVELSRMGRSYNYTKQVWNELTTAGADIVVTSFPILDTRRKDDTVHLMLTDIVFNVLNYLTEQELREKADRCNNGREAALASGKVKFGRKPVTFEDLPPEFLKVMKESKDSNASKTALLDLVNGKLERGNKKKLSRGTFYNYLRIYEDKQP